jgi:excinuclease ABC subunit B
MKFQLASEFEPQGNQPEAIRKLTEGIQLNKKTQVLLRITGSGKTFTMANVIQNVQKPSLILAHNKTLNDGLEIKGKPFLSIG